MPKSKQTGVHRESNILDTRSGFRVIADWGHVGMLEAGGHICELALNSVPDVNPLWRPQWATIDPDRYSSSKHQSRYGPPPDGKLLAGIAGHSLSFDHFGPPSAAETTAGLSTHGEAPALRWKRTRDSAKKSALTYGCSLPEAQIAFSRTVVPDPNHAVVYCEEKARNLSSYDRPISWNEHVTFGPPFLEPGVTLFDMPATKAKVCPPAYSERIFLRPDAEFTWPEAPTKDGGRRSLRTTPDEVFGHYTAQLLDPNRKIAFISACNPAQGLLVVYAFRRTDFPWVGNWEERNNRTTAPWNGKTFCRGMEFSTTPFAIPRRDTIDQGPLFGERTYRWLPAKSEVMLRYLIMLFHIDGDFAGVSDVALDGKRALVRETGARRSEFTVPVKAFLEPV